MLRKNFTHLLRRGNMALMNMIVLEPGWLFLTRESLGLTQAALAEKLKVSRIQITRWERDDLRLTVHSLIRLCKALRLVPVLRPLAPPAGSQVNSPPAR